MNGIFYVKHEAQSAVCKVWGSMVFEMGCIMESKGYFIRHWMHALFPYWGGGCSVPNK